MKTIAIASFVTLTLSVVTAPVPTGAGGPRSLDSALEKLEPGDKIRIQTRDFQMLRGYFVRAADDSLYMTSDDTGAVGYPDIDRLWAFQQHGAARGALWATGVLALGGALTLGLGAETMDEAMGLTVLMGATVVLAGYAFYKGASGSTEKMVYSSYLE